MTTDERLEKLEKCLESQDQATRKSPKQYGGIRRRWFFLGMLGVFTLAVGVPELGCPRAVGILVSFALVIPAFILVVYRLKNIGMSGWWSLLWLVPIIGYIIVNVMCLIRQEGHQETRKLDKTGKVIAGIMLGLLAIMYAYGLMFFLEPWWRAAGNFGPETAREGAGVHQSELDATFGRPVRVQNEPPAPQGQGAPTGGGTLSLLIKVQNEPLAPQGQGAPPAPLLLDEFKVHLAKLMGYLDTAEKLSQNHQYADALARLKNIGTADREFLLALKDPSTGASRGISVEVMETKIREDQTRYLDRKRKVEPHWPPAPQGQGAPPVVQLVSPVPPGPPVVRQAGLRVPPGFRAAVGTQSEPYTNTGWVKEIVHEATGIELLFIPAGRFLMGSPAGEAERINSETHREVTISNPFYVGEETQHEVTISRPFYMGRNAVTQGLFGAFIKDTGYRTEAEKVGMSFTWDGKTWGIVNGASWRNPGFQQTDTHPVTCVSWNDAISFCAWLCRQTGGAVRLPTEAEREYACRAGTQTAYQWGDNPEAGLGWCNGADLTANLCVGDLARKQFGYWPFFTWSDGYIYTSPVGQFRPNALGLYDMHGNVLDWCSDWYGPYPSGRVTDPTGVVSGIYRVARGGCWGYGPLLCRSATRGIGDPSYSSSGVGIRVVLDPK